MQELSYSDKSSVGTESRDAPAEQGVATRLKV